VNQLHAVTSWEELAQWCWEQMLLLRRVWQTTPPFGTELPSTKFEKSIDSGIRSIVRSPAGSLMVPDKNKPWILARLQFGSTLLQPANLRVLELPNLSDPVDTLWFLLLAEWYKTGREFWPLVCGAVNEPDKTLSHQAALSS